MSILHLFTYIKKLRKSAKKVFTPDNEKNERIKKNVEQTNHKDKLTHEDVYKVNLL